jgi:hypothetical protein
MDKEFVLGVAMRLEPIKGEFVLAVGPLADVLFVAV